MRRGTGFAPVKMTGIILHAGTYTHLGEHFQIICGAHGEALRLEFLALLTQFGHALVEFLLDGGQCTLHAFRSGHIMRGREDVHLRLVIDHVAGQGMQGRDMVDFIAEKFYADGEFLIYRNDFDGVTTHSKRLYCIDTNMRNSSSRSICWPSLRNSMRPAYSSGVPKP